MKIVYKMDNEGVFTEGAVITFPSGTQLVATESGRTFRYDGSWHDTKIRAVYAWAKAVVGKLEVRLNNTVRGITPAMVVHVAVYDKDVFEGITAGDAIGYKLACGCSQYAGCTCCQSAHMG